MKIIIGAGCVGLSIAYKLLETYKTAKDIVIIDKFNGNLLTTTFIKLPIEEPNANKKKFSTI